MPVKQYQWRWVCGPRKGRWRPELALARHAAVKAGFASYDPDSDTVYLDELCDIDERPAP